MPGQNRNRDTKKYLDNGVANVDEKQFLLKVQRANLFEMNFKTGVREHLKYEYQEGEADVTLRCLNGEVKVSQNCS